MSRTIEYFKEISKYPRESSKEGKIRDFLVSWALLKGLEYKIDRIGNLIINVEATSDKILSKAVILQSHMDMVCVKTDGSDHDFNSDPIEIIEENGFLKARDTSLGADNGIGVALAMASSEFESHPPLEILLTICEETSMKGALEMDFSLLSGKRIINIDHENENEICISSAGGIGLEMIKDLSYRIGKFPQYRFEIKGLKGGHSGVEIDKNQGNAIEIFMEFFRTYGFSYEIGLIRSGTAPNVIVSQIESVIGIPDIGIFESSFKSYLETVKQKYDCPDISFNIRKEESNLKVMDDIGLLIESILSVKVGVYKMSDKIPDLVETSANLGILITDENTLKLSYLLRSSVNSQLESLTEKIKRIYEDKGFQIQIGDSYPGWQDDPEGELTKMAQNEMKMILGKTPDIIAVHAGLECGAVVSGLGKGSSAISIGPNIFDIHSTKERVEISSVEKMEKILENILKKI